MNHTKITLGELLSHADEIIKRNAMSILKRLQKPHLLDKSPKTWSRKGACPSCNVQTGSKHSNYCTNDYRAAK